MPAGRIMIGTSGWHYPHWRGTVYPEGEGLRPTDYLPWYAHRLGTVEINNTFYRLPKPRTFEHWRDAVPDGFVFACKASRYITHMKKLKDPADSTAKFLAAIEALGDRLGPLLFQLPPNWRCNPERLDGFLSALPAGQRYAFEFRDPSWECEEVYALLDAYGAAFCVSEIAGHCAPVIDCGSFSYVRLHGPGAAYRGSYDDRSLRRWVDRLRDWSAEGRDAYCYFDNDESGHAFHDALHLQSLLD